MPRFAKSFLALGLSFLVFFSVTANAKLLSLEQCSAFIRRALGVVEEAPKSRPSTISAQAFNSLSDIYPGVNFTKNDPAEFIVSRHKDFFEPGGVSRFQIREVAYVSKHSTVIRAFDLKSKQEVAVKILSDGKKSDIISHAMNHALPSLIPVIEYSYNKQARDQPGYLVTSWLNGRSYDEELLILRLGQNVVETKVQIKSYLEKMDRLADGMIEFNKAGWLFTDVKPENFGFDETGNFKVFDLDALCTFRSGRGVDLAQEPGITAPFASPELELLLNVEVPPKNIDYSWLPPGTLVPNAEDSMLNVAALITPKSDAYSFGVILEETINSLLRKNYDTSTKLKLENIKKTIVAPLLISNPSERHSIEQAREALKTAIQGF